MKRGQIADYFVANPEIFFPTQVPLVFNTLRNKMATKHVRQFPIAGAKSVYMDIKAAL